MSIQRLTRESAQWVEKSLVMNAPMSLAWCNDWHRRAGLATKDPKSGSDIPIIWLEVSHVKKGVYFSAVCLSDTSKRFSASVKKTINTSEKKRQARFVKYVKLLESKDADYIWDWWLTGFSGVECCLRMHFRWSRRSWGCPSHIFELLIHSVLPPYIPLA